VRVVNTDAEGRMAMADVLCQAKEEALAGSINPRLLTIATLTGHAVRCVGEGYSIVMVNDPAKDADVALRLQAAGDKLADPFEYSTVRREDWTMISPKYATEDVVRHPLCCRLACSRRHQSRASQIQCNTAASSATARGHQFPAAFLMSPPPSH
jgi:leucyl aminopeptidase